MLTHLNEIKGVGLNSFFSAVLITGREAPSRSHYRPFAGPRSQIRRL